MNFENIFKNKIWIAVPLAILIIFVISLVSSRSYTKNFINLPLDGDYSNIVIGSKEIFLLKDGYIGKFSKEGKEIKRINLPLKNGSMLGDGKTIVYFSNANIYFLDKSGKIISSQKLNFPIENCIFNNNKVLAIGKNAYAIVDVEGNTLFKGFVKGRTITCDLNDNKAIITSIIKKDENQNKVTSFVYSVDLDSKKETVLTFPREVIFYNKLLEDGSVLTVSNVEARVMKDEVILGKKKTNDFKSIGANGDSIYILENDKFGEYDLALINQKKMELKGDFSSLAISKGKVYLYNSKGFAMYENGMVKDFIQTEDIQDVIVNPSDIFFIHSDSVSTK